jgi:hypothetical protein
MGILIPGIFMEPVFPSGADKDQNRRRKYTGRACIKGRNTTSDLTIYAVLYRGIYMRKAGGMIAFILLIAGTAGLLVNEFIFNCGRAATLAFAVLNVAGLVILFVQLTRMR